MNGGLLEETKSQGLPYIHINLLAEERSCVEGQVESRDGRDKLAPDHDDLLEHVLVQEMVETPRSHVHLFLSFCPNICIQRVELGQVIRERVNKLDPRHIGNRPKCVRPREDGILHARNGRQGDHLEGTVELCSSADGVVPRRIDRRVAACWPACEIVLKFRRKPLLSNDQHTSEK